MGTGGTACSSRGHGHSDMLGKVSTFSGKIMYIACIRFSWTNQLQTPKAATRKNNFTGSCVSRRACRSNPCRACVVPRATEQAMSRELEGDSGAMETWLQTSIMGLHALVGRIQVQH